jgi:hypothetical protein
MISRHYNLVLWPRGGLIIPILEDMLCRRSKQRRVASLKRELLCLDRRTPDEDIDRINRSGPTLSCISGTKFLTGRETSGLAFFKRRFQDIRLTIK